MAIISLLTDFGVSDTYVGIMKGVILGIAPGAQLVDLTHEIPPQNLRVGAYRLSTAFSYFPPGSVHLCVVDPGVGGHRRAMAAQSRGHYFVAPDNGVLDCILGDEDARFVSLDRPEYQLSSPSATFHGRDIFSPAAAHLAAGVPLEALGSPFTDPIRLPPIHLRTDGDGLVGEVVDIDRFGNVITSILATDLAAFAPDSIRVELGAVQIHGVCRTYGQAEVGETILLIGSTGRLEISVVNGDGASRLGLKLGDGFLLRGLKRP